MDSEKIGDGRLEGWSPEEVAKARDAGRIVLIDVRTPAEFAFERIPGALLAPLQSFDPGHMPGQDEKAIVFHCGSGMRSQKVAEACLKAGWSKVAHMDGGFGAWKESGLEYTGTNMGTGAPETMRKAG